MDKLRDVAAYKREQDLRRAQRDRAERDILDQLEDVQMSLAQEPTHSNPAAAADASDALSSDDDSLVAEQAHLAEEEAHLLQQLQHLHEHGKVQESPPAQRVTSGLSLPRSDLSRRSRASPASSSQAMASPFPAVYSPSAQRQLQSVAERRGRRMEQLRHEQDKVARELEDLTQRIGKTSSPAYHRSREFQQIPSPERPLRTRANRTVAAGASDGGIGEHSWRPRLAAELPNDPVLEELGQLRQRYLDQGGRSSRYLRQLDTMQEERLEALLRTNSGVTVGPVVAKPGHRPRPLPGTLVNVPNSQAVMSLQQRLHSLEANNRRLLAGISGAHQIPLSIEGQQARRGSQEVETLRRQIDIATEELRLQKLQAELQALKPSKQHAAPAANDLGPSPYDPKSGYIVLWDFILGLPPSLRQCSVSVRLNEDGSQLSSFQPLPCVPCVREDARARSQAGLSQMCSALLKSQQAFPGLSPSSTMKMEIRIHSNNEEQHQQQHRRRTNAVAWTAVDLFDRHHNLLSGRWKVPLRVPPVIKDITTAGLNDIVQYYTSEIYLRLVNARDADVQVEVAVSSGQRHHYHYMPFQASFANQGFPPIARHPAAPNRMKNPAPLKKPAKTSKTESKKKKKPVHKKGPAATVDTFDKQSDSSDSDLSVLSVMSLDETEALPAEEAADDENDGEDPVTTPAPPVEEPDVVLEMLGVELWRVKDVGEGKVTVCLTVRRPDGTISKASGEDMIWTSRATDSFYKTKVQNFGKQQIHLRQAGLYLDSYMLIEVFLQPYVGKLQQQQQVRAAAGAGRGAASGGSKATSTLTVPGVLGSRRNSATASPNQTSPSSTNPRGELPSTRLPKSSKDRRGSQSEPSQNTVTSSTSSPPSRLHSRQDKGKYDEESLVAWTFINIFTGAIDRTRVVTGAGAASSAAADGGAGQMEMTAAAVEAAAAGELDLYHVSSAVHTLRLYQPPVNAADQCTEEDRASLPRLGKGTIRMRLFNDTYPAPSLVDESDQSDLETVELPKEIFLPHDRPSSLTHRYKDSDPIFIFIDGARFLPDNVTVTKATARILDKQYNPIGKELSSMPFLKSDIYNPHFVPAETDRSKLVSYSEKISVCLELPEDVQVARTATLVIKLYTVDGYSKRIAAVGYAVLKLFVTVPGGEQPSNASTSMKVALNAGCHQLRLYSREPVVQTAMSDQLFTGNRYVPCATVLVRVCKCKPEQLIEGTQLPAELRDAPSYSSGLYINTSIQLTDGEKHLMLAMHKRAQLPVRNSVPLLGDPSWSQLDRTPAEIAEFIKGKLSRSLDSESYNLDITYISKYTPTTGLLVSIDEATNLPWKKVTQAVAAFTPPGSFFMGQFHDSVQFTTKLDWQSPQNCPRWHDGVWLYRRRHLHFHLSLVIMLQAVDITFKRNKQKFQLAEQAWCAVPVFSDGYAFTERYQLPLFQGRPTATVLEVLQSAVPSDGDLMTFYKDVRKIKAIEGASLTVRVADVRRRQEIENLEILHVNPWYLPEDKRSKYLSRKPDKKTMRALLPPGETTESIESKMNFKQHLLTAMMSWKG
eukprot:scpid7195/ scgid1142/ Coiled-coil domain-containing protein 17